MAEESKNCFECSNWYLCIKQISEELIDNNKKTLHELYCHRNLFRCSCGEIIDRKEKEEHNEEFHSEVTCQNCGEKYERWKLEAHPCKSAPRICSYCENTFPVSEFKDHIVICGSKTDLCPQCDQYVSRSQWLIHEQSTCKALACVFPSLTPNRMRTLKKGCCKNCRRRRIRGWRRLSRGTSTSRRF
eukprot:TRINITY_DN9454_c0_g2_i5.p1 TRINITY_DN9454_c0_g2~~TRINITY_DN9454_c0_g2_i5.p1  ORF type:complete len:187 (+),score=8.12 TRINITY_DN9454_c0_g2_i5:131-691(+)